MKLLFYDYEKWEAVILKHSKVLDYGMSCWFQMTGAQIGHGK